MPGIQNYITLFYSASVICGSPAIRDSFYSVLGALTNPRATHNSIYHSVEIKYPMYTTKSHIICASEIRSRPPQEAKQYRWGPALAETRVEGGHSCHTLPCFLLHSSGKQQYTGSGQPQNAPFHICNPSTTAHQGGHKAGRRFILPTVVLGPVHI